MLTVVALTVSCAPVEEKVPVDSATGDASVDFYNASNFDWKMSSALRAKPPTVTVVLLAPTTLNDIPERLGSWLSMVEKYHGKVELHDDSEVRTRSIGDLSMAVAAIVMLYKLVQEKTMYGPVEAYNATIHYKSDGTGSGHVSRVVFTRKDTTPASGGGSTRWQ